MLNETKKPTVMIVDSDPSQREMMKQIFVSIDWEAVSHDSPSDALELLDKRRSSPFVLIVCGVNLNGINGSDFLAKAEAISPLTRRMLVLPRSENKALIEAINSTDIHACMTTPFDKSDLVSKAENALYEFTSIKKKEIYKRLVKRQNQELFLKSKSLKHKEEKLAEQLKTRKKK
ncbi:hypothetical protein MTBBW1_750032 [Desulfamplus magnetovallimortis]|uniref:Response regulatory domain-containing protein n=1 Tax=Desulfamplus magnetovallimortis TaxID=1246637 RepID=A0A1W1HJ30_9BACT|nr:response regulator [Desulfamplus magnetovallimortis]SLM32511.1 hypothetical protein MTBBW1_750032 [Desulfamplus magnetovallimortis]